jgi:hypothetical protein
MLMLPTIVTPPPALVASPLCLLPALFACHHLAPPLSLFAVVYCLDSLSAPHLIVPPLLNLIITTCSNAQQRGDNVSGSMSVVEASS